MAELDMTRIPEHIGIILDGNGRWAKKRHMPRMYGHRHGAFTLRDIARGFHYEALNNIEHEKKWSHND